ncbi:MAG: hypothetical protein H6625_09050 [Bdellovibrionaceae bacterium]|nr:hypothetical protein [Pseudobdellovibrionaceae bacterium]
MKNLSLIMALALILPFGANAKMSSSSVQLQTVQEELNNINELLGGDIVILKIDQHTRLEDVMEELKDVEKALVEGRDAVEEDYIHLACKHPVC